MVPIRHRGRRLAASLYSQWSPIALPSLALWLDAADPASMTFNGAKIIQWNDKSGNGRHVSQGTDATRPTFTENGLNGRSVATADGTQYMTGSGFSHSGVFSAGVVFGVTGNGQSAFQIGAINTYGSVFAEGAFFKARPANAGGATAAFTPGVETVLLSATIGASADIWKNGTLGTNYAGTASSCSGQAFTIFALNASTYRLNGFISEIIITASVLGTEERQKLEGYLAWKWGRQANLPDTHPYKRLMP